MNSYPHEFLAHPQPLMFVAGLTPTKRERATSHASQLNQSSQEPGTSDNISTIGESRSRSGSTAATASLEAPSTHSAGALTTPVGSPQPRTKELPLSPTRDAPGHGAEHELEEEGGGVEGDDEFVTLRRHLRESLAVLGKKNKMWLRETERRTFRVMLVDKGIRLPQRKITPSTSGSQSPSAIPHSPLSPHTPTSPLYPDGLMAPIWVKKHAEIVPAVFVMFLRLYEAPTPAKVPGEADDEAAGRARREADKAMEKDADEGLVKEIAERRRRLGERGIKLTVVLMASAAALDSPSLDARLSYLRRASQLSSKASLFVLSPVPADQLPEFIQSLQDALYEPAMEYYSQHSKRVKRKRSRLPASGSTTPSALQGQGKSLPPQGWIVRYEWKAGWFAEIRGELEEARRHYEDCWNELARMFASTQVLPPRTKQWAEAKVLADCVAMRICRLLLYADEGAKVLGPFFIHLKRFGDYSRGWGIGEDTFEFWSWIARQYRIFAELLEIGVQAGIRMPRIASPTFPSVQTAVSPLSLADLATPISANNPLHILQPPAFYFYTAALCSVQRQQRFQEALATEQESLEASVAAGYSPTVSPGYDNEKRVDHSALIIELYTKAYSLFKEQEGAQNRTALYVAYRIAETYCSAEQYDLAMRFFERISPTFKNDKWTPIGRQIRELWYTCSQRTGHVEHAARLLIEMMSPDSGIEGDERIALQDDLLSLMRTTSPASADPITVETSAESPLLHATAAYWQPQTHTTASSPIQVALTCPDTTHIGNLQFESLTIVFGGSLERADCIVKAGEEAEIGRSERIIDIGDLASHGPDGFSADRQLSWQPGGSLLLHGMLTSDREGQVPVDSVRLRLAHGSWKIDTVIPVQPATTWKTAGGHLPISPAPHVSFVARPYDVALRLDAPQEVFVGEETPITVVIDNKDDRAVQVSMLPFLEGSSEADDTSLQVVDAPEKGMHGYALGVVPAGGQASKTLVLLARQIGSKRIDVAVRVSPVNSTTSDSNAEDAEAESHADGAENRVTLDLEQSAEVEAHLPFDFMPHVSYGPIKRSEEGNTCAVMVTASLAAPSRRFIQCAGIKLVEDNVPKTKLTWSSLEHVPFIPHANDKAPVHESIATRFMVFGPADRIPLENATALSPAHLEVEWRSNGEYEYTTTSTPLPALSFPTQNSFLSAHITHPSIVQNQRPFRLSVTINNSHPSQSMSGLVMQVDMSDSFVWHGERTTRLPTVRPDGSAEVGVVLVPVVGKAGRWELPRVRVYHPQRMQLEREEIRVEGEGSVHVLP